jgi:hypothetical protein
MKYGEKKKGTIWFKTLPEGWPMSVFVLITRIYSFSFELIQNPNY